MQQRYETTKEQYKALKATPKKGVQCVKEARYFLVFEDEEQQKTNNKKSRKGIRHRSQKLCLSGNAHLIAKNFTERTAIYELYHCLLSLDSLFKEGATGTEIKDHAIAMQADINESTIQPTTSDLVKSGVLKPV